MNLKVPHLVIFLKFCQVATVGQNSVDLRFDHGLINALVCIAAADVRAIDPHILGIRILP